MEDDHKTQKLFFNAITRKKLNELLKRADADTRVLEMHINERLNDSLRSHVDVNNKSSQSYCDILINYYENHTYLGHFTVHCKMDDLTMCNTSRKNGRIHLKNKNNTCYTIKCNARKLQNANDSVTMKYRTWQFIRPKLKQCLDATLSVLNDYMDFNSELSLDIQLTKYKLDMHPCVEMVVNKFNARYKTRLRKTHRVSLQTRRMFTKNKSHARVDV
jgi:hypothetical protein